MGFTSPALIKAANDALVGIRGDINIAKLFAHDMSDDVADFGATIKVPVVSATASELCLHPGEGQTLNDYETDTGATDWADVVLNHQPKATQRAPAAAVFDAPNAPYWEKFKTALVEAVAANISIVLGGLFTAGACTGGKAVMASVTKANLAKLRTETLGRVRSTVLALDPVAYADALAVLDVDGNAGDEAIMQGYIRGLYGFKAVVMMNDLPGGVKGALIPDTAVAVAARSTIKSTEGYIEAGTFVDENGFPITVTRHFSPAKREEFLNADVLWGAKLIQPAKVKYIAAS